MDQRIIELYDEYTHAPLSRSIFLQRLALITGSMTAALAILPQIEVNARHASVTPADELHTERISYEGVNGQMQGYLARPKEDKPYAAVVVIHENRGLNAHIEDVARRAAQAGFLALAPNALAPLGGTPTDDDEARTKFQQLKPDESLQNFLRAFDFLKNPEGRQRKHGMCGILLGWCHGQQPGRASCRFKSSRGFLWPTTGCVRRSQNKSRRAITLRFTGYACQ